MLMLRGRSVLLDLTPPLRDNNNNNDDSALAARLATSFLSLSLGRGNRGCSPDNCDHHFKHWILPMANKIGTDAVELSNHDEPAPHQVIEHELSIKHKCGQFLRGNGKNKKTNN